MTTSHSDHHPDLAKLDQLTGGAFTAPTAGERSARIKEWLSSGPDAEHLAQVFKELSVKDKGAARWVKERIDESKRAKGQEQLGQEWADKAQLMIDAPKLNIADAMAWQRDAAKAGAPLSKEPLLTLKTRLAERVKTIEDLAHQTQVQREAAVLLAQRIEILSTKPLADAMSARESLTTDIAHWQGQADALRGSDSWASVDVKFPSMLESSRAQLHAVWDAFVLASDVAANALNDDSVALPLVPVWADEVRAKRGIETPAPKIAKIPVDPELRIAANKPVQLALEKLEIEIAQGHGKASAGAAAALRQALKEAGKLLDARLDGKAHLALGAAGELEGWQRWRADQIRQELLGKAEALLAPSEGKAIGGRKLQEQLRNLREQWKLSDQGGPANQALWKRFDDACNQAYKTVEVWLEKVKEQAVENRKQRLELIEHVKAWAQANQTALDGDWKGFARILNQFADQWRNAGHLGEKAFAELQPLWKAALTQAASPLEAMQTESIALRRGLIQESQTLAISPQLRNDAVRSLQQRWQAQAQAVPIDRRLEQKLWDAFRKPFDDAFHRKNAEHVAAQALLGERDRAVLDASKAVQLANASGDAQTIRHALQLLEASLRGQTQAQQSLAVAQEQHTDPIAVEPDSALQNLNTDAQPNTETGQAVQADVASDTKDEQYEQDEHDKKEAKVEVEPAPVDVPVKAAPKPVRAVRGDDRPGMKKETPAAPNARGFKPRDARDANPANKRSSPYQAGSDRPAMSDRRDDLPRLGDAAFRAQRDAMDQAQFALRKLAAQAHGEVLVQLLAAWEQRQPDRVPAAKEFGGNVVASTRSSWVQAIGSAPKDANSAAEALRVSEALLRLEMAAEVPTPADQMDARRALQLKLLTRRNDPAPLQTWGADSTAVLSVAFEPEAAQRLQKVLKVLVKR